MAVYYRILLAVLAFQVVLSYRRMRPRHCVKITPKTAPLCANLSLGYDKMMLPNFLQHDSYEEVREELGRWNPLVGAGCHPLLKHFLCTVFAPVCIIHRDTVGDRGLIPPCRSLCSMVRLSCEPLMKLHNYTWPAKLNCSMYPENSMCVKLELPTELPTPSVCAHDKEKAPNPDVIKRNFCQSNFAIKARVIERKQKDGFLIIKVLPSRVLKGRFKKGLVRLRIPQQLEGECQYVQPRKHPYLILGTKRGKRAFVRYLVKYRKWRKFGPKLREKSCRRS